MWIPGDELVGKFATRGHTRTPAKAKMLLECSNGLKPGTEFHFYDKRTFRELTLHPCGGMLFTNHGSRERGRSSSPRSYTRSHASRLGVRLGRTFVPQRLGRSPVSRLCVPRRPVPIQAG